MSVIAWLTLAHASSAQDFSDDFTTAGDRLDRTRWTTEFGPASFLGRTQLRDWVSEDGIGRFIVAGGTAQLALDTFNPTGFSLYGTHAKTRGLFAPSSTSDIVLSVRMRLTSLQRGLVFGVYFYGCGESCADDHDEVDIELLTNALQAGGPLTVQLNRYAAEPSGAGHPDTAPLPPGFDPLAFHEWKIRWHRTSLTFYVDSSLLFSTTSFVAQRPMHADMIAWGPASDWSAAYDGSLQPVADSGANQRFTALVDRFVVTAIPTFTDESLQPASTVVRSVHINELRQHVDALRSREHLANFAWSDGTLLPGESTIRAQHILDLREALAEVYAARALTPPTYTDATVATGVTIIKALHITELRNAVRALE
jgi:hypothetical protein